MYWRCDHCGTIHTQNPRECRRCGHGVFAPVSAAELERHSEGTEAPEAMTDVPTYGSASESSGVSGPDVALDGSVQREEFDDSAAEQQGWLSRALAWFRRG